MSLDELYQEYMKEVGKALTKAVSDAYEERRSHGVRGVNDGADSHRLRSGEAARLHKP